MLRDWINNDINSYTAPYTYQLLYYLLTTLE